MLYSKVFISASECCSYTSQGVHNIMYVMEGLMNRTNFQLSYVLLLNCIIAKALKFKSGYTLLHVP